MRFLVLLVLGFSSAAGAAEVCKFKLGEKKFQIEQVDLSEARSLVASRKLYTGPMKLDLDIALFPQVDRDQDSNPDLKKIDSDVCVFQSKRSIRFVRCRYSFDEGYLYYYPYTRQGAGAVMKNRMNFSATDDDFRNIKITCENSFDRK